MKYLPLTCSDRLLDVFNIVFVTEFLRHSSIEVLDLDDDGNCGVLSELGVNEVVNVLVAETFECDIGD